MAACAVGCCGGDCYDTATDPNNCGKCNNVCSSGECRSGRCLVTPTKLATAGTGAFYLTVAGSSVFWTEVPSVTSGIVRRVSTNGGTPEDIGPFANAGKIFVLGNEVYWGFQSGLEKVAIGGGSPVAVGTGLGQVFDFSLVGSTLYYSARGPLYKVALPNGVPQSFANVGGANHIQVDSSFVYYSDNNSKKLMKVPLAGGMPTALASVDEIGALLLNGQFLYWGERFLGTIWRMPVAGGAASRLATGDRYLYGLAVDGNNIYWSDSSGIYEIPGAGGDPILLAIGRHFPGPIALDATSIYWLTYEPTNEALYKLAK